jgi:medium-chain acyl-[acyl-carrier-protein] hydrolase
MVSNSVSNSTNALTKEWFSIPSRSAEAKMWLFCFPYAGSGAAAYFPWAKLLPSEVALCAIRLPGRESRLRQQPYLHMEPLVQELAGALMPLLDRPFAFFGHSMGALIAFEIARSLRREKAGQPLHLFASAHRAPQLPDLEPPLYQLPDEKLVQELDRRYGGIPAAILQSDELLKLFLPMMRADTTVLDTYVYQEEPPLALPISVYGGSADSSVHDGELEGWGEQTQARFRLKIFEGDHFFLRGAQAQVVQTLNDELGSYLL